MAHLFGWMLFITLNTYCQMLRDLFSQTVTFARILGVDKDLSAQLNAAAARLPPFLIGSGGQLQEWLTGESR
jgi:hypothetical protein